MQTLVLYEKPSCSKCRAAAALLDASGRAYRRVRYHDARLSQKKLLELMRKSDLPPAAFVRAHEPAFTALGRPAGSFSEKEIAALLAEHPELIERPILECGGRATIGRPTERAAAFIDACAARS